MNTLYDLTKELADLEAEIEARGGELTPDLEATLDALTGSVQEKVDNILRWIENLKAETEALTGEWVRLGEKMRRKDARIIWLRTHLANCLRANGLPSVKTPLRTVSVRPSPDQVVIEDEGKVPPEFWGERKTPYVSLALIADSWRQGKAVDGTRWETDRTHIQIR